MFFFHICDVSLNIQKSYMAGKRVHQYKLPNYFRLVRRHLQHQEFPYGRNKGLKRLLFEISHVFLLQRSRPVVPTFLEQSFPSAKFSKHKHHRWKTRKLSSKGLRPESMDPSSCSRRWYGCWWIMWFKGILVCMPSGYSQESQADPQSSTENVPGKWMESVRERKCSLVLSQIRRWLKIMFRWPWVSRSPNELLSSISYNGDKREHVPLQP